MINNDTIVSQSKNLLATQIDDELVIMDINSENYLRLNDIGSHIWAAIEKPVKVREVCKTMLDSYDDEYNQCQTDVLDFLQTLSQASLINCVSERLV